MEHDDDDPPSALPGSKFYMKPAGHARLRAELAQRRTERHRTVEIVAWAASNGDRSENADYKEGKRRLREIDRRLRFLMNRIAHAEVVDPAEQAQRDFTARFQQGAVPEDLVERLIEIDAPSARLTAILKDLAARHASLAHAAAQPPK